MSNIPNALDNVRFNRIQLLDGDTPGGVAITYDEKTTVDYEVKNEDGTISKESMEHWLTKTVKSTITRRASFDTAAEALKIHVARIFGILAIGLYKPEADMNAQERKFLESVLREMEIVSVTFSGAGEKTGVVLSAKRTIMGNKTIVMTTPNLGVADTRYEFMDAMIESLKNLRDEAFGYVFKRQYAQLQLPFDKTASLPEAEAEEVLEG